MSTDRRRLTGPSDVKTPLRGISLGASTLPKKFTPPDSSPRKFFVKSGLTKNANGLAYLEAGTTIVEVGVYGPRPIRGSFIDRASFSVECKFLPYLTQPNEVIFNGSEKRNARTSLTHIEHRISKYVETAFLPSICLEKYPKSAIDIYVNVIAFDAQTQTLSNLVAWVVNCTALALVDSAIEVKDLVTGGHARMEHDGEVKMDAVVDSGDETVEGTECVASFMKMHENQMVAIWVESNGSLEVDEQGLEKLMNGCDTMATEVRKNLNGYLLLVANGNE